ncbi:hypothetical protein PAXRUDRAFT_143078 [Paxillus rubicundulus Ve08.2h10]|uniref:Uncharacterized protein n=1 Tax=Paxillus rubicundulus Ve08.2h10 TaxID=930991 RepID=A0A0D0E1R5_9AGAM|nr:hypothetical protein PAXRUDRAFT_143078 [Paxillus rubicundulus Ve08.2h10]
MKVVVNSRLLTFILLNSLPKTLEWNMFTSSVINTVKDSKLTFDTTETQITSEEVHINPSRSLDSTLKSSAHLHNSTTWCKHHQQSRHNSDDCYAYQHWTRELRKGGGGGGKREMGEKEGESQCDGGHSCHIPCCTSKLCSSGAYSRPTLLFCLYASLLFHLSIILLILCLVPHPSHFDRHLTYLIIPPSDSFHSDSP